MSNREPGTLGLTSAFRGYTVIARDTNSVQRDAQAPLYRRRGPQRPN